MDESMGDSRSAPGQTALSSHYTCFGKQNPLSKFTSAFSSSSDVIQKFRVWFVKESR